MATQLGRHPQPSISHHKHDQPSAKPGKAKRRTTSLGRQTRSRKTPTESTANVADLHSDDDDTNGLSKGLLQEEKVKKGTDGVLRVGLWI